MSHLEPTAKSLKMPEMPTRWDGGSCMYCGSGNLEAGNGDHNGGYSETVDCLDCGESWYENYALVNAVDGNGNTCLADDEYQKQQVIRAVQLLTTLGTTDDGGIIIGPQGWELLQRALAGHGELPIT